MGERKILMNITSGKILTAQKVVIYGPEGIGKTTFASRFPNPLFCDTEGGTKNLDIRRFDRPTSAQMIDNCIDFVKAHPDVCSTFVLDTADWAEDLLIKNVCAINNKSGIEDFGYGNGYTYSKEAFGKLLNHLDDLIDFGINVVVTAHAMIQKFEEPEENGAYNRWTLKLINTPKCSNVALLKEWADTVLFINYKTYVEQVDKQGKKFKASGGKRVMYTAHHPCWDAKNRWGLPDECDFDYSVIAPFIPAKSPSLAPSAPTTSTAPVDAILDTEQPPTAPPTHEHTDALTGVPKSLASLMRENNVTTEDIQVVVSQQGYYPRSTPITAYDPDFVEGCLVGAWPQVLNKIMSNKDLPFDMKGEK